MIVDTSALVAILTREEEREAFTQVIIDSAGSSLSAASYVECGIVIDRLGDPVLSRYFDALLRAMRVTVVEVTPDQALIAREAYRDFGRGSGHRARLNYGDCFSYALAVSTDDALLYKGDDFIHTDVRSAA